MIPNAVLSRIFSRGPGAHRPGRRTSLRFFPLLMFFAAGGFLHAQIAAEMDVLLETRAVTFAQASRFVLASADTADDNPADVYPADEPSAAYALARENGWLPKNAAPDRPVRLGELCFLIMNAFDIKGSFLYALFPGPHYAFRELDYLRLIPGRRDPALRVSGEELLRMLDMAAARKGAEPAAPPPAAETPPPIPADHEVLPVLAAEREQLAGEIRTELQQYEVADTTVRVAEEGIVISLNDIRFLPDSVELTEGEKTKLRDIAAILSRHPDRKIQIGGHTTQAGSGEGRLRISSERARAVADFLITLGVRQAEEITVIGYGAARPLGNNATAEGQALNRRVEIVLLDE